MPRHNRGSVVESLIGGGKECKIRKRGCSSSSSASSMLQSYRFKRAVLINKKGGSTTPNPRWRMSSRSPAASRLRMPVESPLQKGKHATAAPVSARKLAASLWEINEMNSARFSGVKSVNKESRNRDKIAARSVQSIYLPHHLSDPSHSPVSERMDRSVIGSHYARNSNLSHKIRQHGHKIGGFDSASNASFMEIEARSRRPTPTGSIIGFKTHLKELNNGLTTSEELLKILSRMWGIEEHYSSGKSILSALCSEHERARQLVDHLIKEQHSNHKESNYLAKYFAEEKAAWKKKSNEKIETAVKSISNDLEMEKKLRKRTESLTKTLGRELAETKSALSKVVKELESERRARVIMEQVGDELAKGIGEDRALVEQLKKESLKVREEVEKEREMLQLADVLREERVQMKLLEAKYQFEEKNAAVEKLRSELEAFLRAKEAKENQCGSHNGGGMVEVGGHLVNVLAAYQNQDIRKGKGGIEYKERCKDFEIEDDSTESDLHSIELNMENNNRNHMWTYAIGTAQEDQKRLSVDKDFRGRKSSSGKLTRGRLSLESRTSDGIEWDFSTERCTNWGEGYKIEKQAQRKSTEVDRQRHKSIKDLRDYIASRLAPNHGFASPTKQWEES